MRALSLSAKIAVSCLAAAAATSFLLAPGASGQRHPPRARASALESGLLALLNSERSKHGLRALTRAGALDRSAGWQSHDMVARRYFAHRRRHGPGLLQRVRRTGYLHRARRWTLGENIAWAQMNVARSRLIVSAWMASPTHRRNILNPAFQNIGISVVPGDAGQSGGGPALTITTDFGFRLLR